MQARDRLDERLRSAALPPRFSANPPRSVFHSSLSQNPVLEYTDEINYLELIFCARY